MAHKSGEIIKQLGRFFNHKVSFDKNYISAKFVLPGFQYSHIDRAGHINIFQLIRFMGVTRIIPLAYPQHSIEDESDASQQLVMFAQDFSIDRSFYENAAMEYPLEMAVSVTAVGRTSLVKKITLLEIESRNEVVTRLQKLVNLNSITKRSCNLSEITHTRCEAVVKDDPKNVFPECAVPQLPELYYTTERVVYPSDMDSRFHTNHASYMQFALDAASEASENGFYKRVTCDICFYKPKAAATLYLSESFAGDHLKIHTWQDSEKLKLYFLMKKDNINVYYCSLDFFEQQ